MSVTSPSANPAELFIKSWQIYQDIIHHNYMFHREISAEVFKSLGNFKCGQSINVLDLGCGDASMTLPLLPVERIRSYVACDLSQPALDIARSQLEALKIPHELICDNMVLVAGVQPKNSCDVVLSSYAIHHLEAKQKVQLIEAIASALAPGGILVLIDVFREPGESHADYMSHYTGFLKMCWVKLSQEAQRLVVEHITTTDFPELPEFYENLCQAKGLTAGKRLGKHTWHEAWLFSKLPSRHP